ncbi:MAG: hypothetical protein ACKV2Q_32850 [Planctomycetaceae bacterium]
MTIWPSVLFGARRRAHAIVQAIAQLDDAFDLNLVHRLESELERDLADMIRRRLFEDVAVELQDSSSGRCLKYRIPESGELCDQAGRAVELQPRAARRGQGRWVARLFVKLRPSAAREEHRHQLRLDWRSAYRGETQRSTGTERRRLRVVSTGQRGFAFGNSVDAGQPLRDVFLHLSDAPAGFGFVVGQIVSAEVATTASGLQGRRIRSV